MPKPIKGDRAVRDCKGYPLLHASDLEANTPIQHLPISEDAGDITEFDGTKWVAKPHADLSTIHKGAYVQSTDPGAVGADKLWLDTTSGPPYALKVRNAGNSAWTTCTVSSFLGLSDAPDAYTDKGGYVVKVKVAEDGLEFVAGGAGVSSFNDLDDVPASYSGQAGKYARVNGDEDGLEFAEAGGGSSAASNIYMYSNFK